MTTTDTRSATRCRHCDAPLHLSDLSTTPVWVDGQGWDSCEDTYKPHEPIPLCRVHDEILPWVDKDRNLNIREGDLILDEGAMCAVEAIDIEVLDDKSLRLHVSLRDPRRVNTGLPVYASEFAGDSLTAVRRYVTEEAS